MNELDEFTRAYITTALWSTTGEEDEPLDKHYDKDDIADETLTKMVEDCRLFQEQNGETIRTADVKCGPDFGPMGRAGHDFWLTREGHGAGFWDGDWPEEAGEKLTEASKKFGGFDLYVGDDGKIHH